MNTEKIINLALIGCGNFSDSLAMALQKSKKAKRLPTFPSFRLIRF